MEIVFIAVSWVILVASLLLFSRIYTHHRYLLVKPSVIMLFAAHLFLQWPAALQSERFYNYLPSPWAFLIIVQLYVFLGLLFIFYTWRSHALVTYQKLLTSASVADYQLNRQATIILLIAFVTLISIYLYYVPLTSTGLYSIVFQQGDPQLAREQSLKLLTNPFPKYSYSLLSSAVCPLLASALVVALLYKKTTYINRLVLVLAILIVATALVLPGSKYGLVTLILIIIATYYFNNKLTFNPWFLVTVISILIFLLVLLAISREGVESLISPHRWFQYLHAIYRRIFNVPLIVGSWFIHHAQTEGAFGIAAIPRLARLFDVEPVNAQHILGLKYAPLFFARTLTTVSANAGFMFTNYGYFGNPAIPLSFLFLIIIDLVTPLLSYLPRYLLAISIPSMAVGTIAFLSSDFTTVLLTHGFAIKLFLIFSILVAIKLYAGSRTKIQQSKAESIRPKI